MFCFISQVVKDGFVCPGADGPFCTVYSEQGVRAFNRQNFCAFKDVRKPVLVPNAKKKNPLKASKKK